MATARQRFASTVIRHTSQMIEAGTPMPKRLGITKEVWRKIKLTSAWKGGGVLSASALDKIIRGSLGARAIAIKRKPKGAKKAKKKAAKKKNPTTWGQAKKGWKAAAKKKAKKKTAKTAKRKTAKKAAKRTNPATVTAALAKRAKELCAMSRVHCFNSYRSLCIRNPDAGRKMWSQSVPLQKGIVGPVKGKTVKQLVQALARDSRGPAEATERINFLLNVSRTLDKTTKSRLRSARAYFQKATKAAAAKGKPTGARKTKTKAKKKNPAKRPAAKKAKRPAAKKAKRPATAGAPKAQVKAAAKAKAKAKKKRKNPTAVASPKADALARTFGVRPSGKSKRTGLWNPTTDAVVRIGNLHSVTYYANRHGRRAEWRHVMKHRTVGVVELPDDWVAMRARLDSDTRRKLSESLSTKTPRGHVMAKRPSMARSWIELGPVTEIEVTLRGKRSGSAGRKRIRFDSGRRPILLASADNGILAMTYKGGTRGVDKTGRMFFFARVGSDMKVLTERGVVL